MIKELIKNDIKNMLDRISNSITVEDADINKDEMIKLILEAEQLSLQQKIRFYKNDLVITK